MGIFCGCVSVRAETSRAGSYAVSDLNPALINIVNIPIATLTTTYTPNTGGAWTPDNKNPSLVDQANWATTGSVTAFRANVITRSAITTLTVGVPSGAAAGGNVAFSWTPDGRATVVVPQTGALGKLCPFGASSLMPLNGTPVNIGAFGTQLQTLDNNANTTTPDAYYNPGGPVCMNAGGYGCMYSYTLDLNDYAGKWDGTTNLFGASGNLAGFNTTTRGFLQLPVLGSAGLENVFMSSTAAPPVLYQQFNLTLLRPNQSHNSVGLVNPSSFTQDLNAWFAQATNRSTFQATSMGWLSFILGPNTFNGITNSQGWGILIKPDFSGYYLLNITGTDGNTINWKPSSGSMLGTIDWAPDLLMKPANNQTNIYISVAQVNLQPQTTGILSPNVLAINSIPHVTGILK